MTTIRTVHDTDQVKVAVVFELDHVRPAWFQVAGKKPVEITQICAVWYHNRGAAKFITFEIWDSSEKYSLEFDTLALAWSIGRTVFE